MTPPRTELRWRLSHCYGISARAGSAPHRPPWGKGTFGRAQLTSPIRCRGGRSFRFAQIGLIGELDAILERGARAPAQFGEPADIEQFARRAVGPRGVEADRAGISDSRRHHAREFGDRDVLAGADI